MSQEDIIVMNIKEVQRIGIIQQVISKQVKQVEAAKILGLSNRQIRRIAKRVKVEGEKGIIHRSRGEKSNRKFPESLRKQGIRLYQKKYSGFGPTLANEKLLEEGIKISTQTLRNWLAAEGLWEKQRKRKKHRQWRQRKEYFGQMVQIDGSHHDWLEGRGPELVLMGYIDDATNRVFARFYDYEGTIPALDSFKGYIQDYGIPQSVYLDKHSTYKSQAKPSIEDELSNRRPLSQFERAMAELGVQVIHAHSPQAKGRIERLFGTFQDRLVKELRLKGISNKEGANRFLASYLPGYNQRYSFPPAQAANLHREVPAGLEVDGILCIKNTRTVRNDTTIRYNKRLYQLEAVRVGSKVMVQERTDGSIAIKYKNNGLKFKEITPPPLTADRPAVNTNLVRIETAKFKKRQTPVSSHPWRNFSFGQKRGHF